jgi:protocatechuate 3,4-dioxygenase beta subunit
MPLKQTLTAFGTLVVSSGLTAAFVLAPHAQSPSPAGSVSATISGLVRASSSSQPLQGATVTLYGSQFPEGRIAATTDDRGAFTFSGLAAGLYAIGARKDGFANVGYRQRRFGSGAPLFRVRDGEQMAVDLSLPGLSAISGVVSDERGNPIAKATVRALRYNMSAGYVRPQDLGVATSDDRGVYRIQSLQPGDYGICAVTKATLPLNEPQRLQAEIDRLLWQLNLARGSGSPEMRSESVQQIAALEAKLPDRIDPVYGYAPRCTPEPLSSAAVKIAVGPGEALSGVDIQFPLTRLARLEGVVTGVPDFDRAPNLTAVLISEESRDVQRMETMRLGPDREFRFTNVVPDEYYLMVQDSPPGGGRIRLLASMPMVVTDSDVSGIVLSAPRPATISGRVVFNGGAVPSSTALEGVRVYLDPSPSRPATRYQIRTSDLHADGTFTVSDVFPGAYRVWLTTIGREGWTSERSTWGTQDVFEEPLQVRAGETVTDVTIHATDRIAELTGTLLDEQGEPATDYLVLVYPVEKRYWNAHAHRMPSARAGRDGRFRVPIVRPGQYRVATLLDVEPFAWFDAEFVRALEPLSIPISIAAREKKEMNLRVPRPE